MATRIAESWTRRADEVLAAIVSTETGLSGADAANRLATDGPNRLPEPPRPSILRRVAHQFDNLLILVLVAAAAITALLGHWVDTAVIGSIVVINAAIGFVQEGRAEQALEALRGMLAPKASVLRDGTRRTVAAFELVPGDVVFVEAGDKVPADLRLLQISGLTVDESILTGESVPVRKDTAPVAKDVAIGDRTAMAFSGTLVSEGSATGVVVATGGHTEIGRISGMMAAVETLTTPLVRQMAEFARYLTGFVLAASLAVLAFATMVRGVAFPEAFMIVVGLFVAAIPEALPAVLTVTLAIGVQTMARRNAIVRRLPSIETLGAVSTICSDKTGTLTRNEMTVASVVTAAGTYAVTGLGYAPEGDVVPEIGASGSDPALPALGRIAWLCNTAALRRDDSRWSVEGDPMEGALLALAGKLGQPWCDRPKAIHAIPFDPRYRYMAVLHEEDGERAIMVKGAPEQIVARCSAQLSADGPVPIDRIWWEERAHAVASEGRRVLALACKDHAGEGIVHDDIGDGLVLVGLCGLIDPPRPEAVAAVADCHAAGIEVKMITGDHAGTAVAIGRQIGLRMVGKALTGQDIDRLDEDQLREAIGRTDVFARTSPEHKLRLVTALQARGAVVAMTGDGANDAPALKRADAGIAMGVKGSQAAREAADIVLADDNFASIAEAVRQGRTVYANLKKVVTFLLPVNGGESLSLVIAVLFGLTLPITPLQILWINMVSSAGLAMALAFEPPEPGIMRRPPRRADAPILSRFVLWRVLFVSAAMSVGIFVQFELALAAGQSVAVARTLALNSLVAMEVFYLFSIRYRLGASITWTGAKGTPAVLVAIGIVTLLQLAFIYVPFMNTLFETTPLTALQLAQCTAAGVALFLLLETDKLAARLWKSRR